MKKTGLLMSGLLLVSALANTSMANSDFGLLDNTGKFHQLSRYRHLDAVAVMSYAANNDGTRAAAERFAQSCQAAGEQLLCFLINATDEVDAIRSHTAPGGLPVLIDSAQIVSRTLDITHHGQVVTLNPASHDPLDPYVPEFAELTQTSAVQYRFIDALADRTISYQEEIAPLLQQRCAYCHVENGLAPWAMNRYLMVMGWSPMMRETLITRRMPPGQIDDAVGDWQNTHNLSDAELALLVEWIDRGAPREGDGDPLAAPRPEAEPWPLGEPDLIVELPEQELPATGNVDFIVERVPLNLPDNRWLRAISYQIGDKSVLHSLLVYALDKQTNSNDPDDLISDSNADYISVYVPGELSDSFADDTGFLLGAGHDLAIKLRYLTSGRPTVDRTRIGLYFHDETPARQLQTIALENPDLQIPPNVVEHTESLDSAPLAVDAWLESYSPHAHSRGKSMSVSAISPQGDEELLINVANFNYNWQLAYRPSQEKLLPAGTVLSAETIYDNSASNPFNPEPDLTVDAGYSDRSEMFSHFIRIAVPITDAAHRP
jgi:hypothetical protein